MTENATADSFPTPAKERKPRTTVLNKIVLMIPDDASRTNVGANQAWVKSEGQPPAELRDTAKLEAWVRDTFPAGGRFWLVEERGAAFEIRIKSTPTVEIVRG